MNPKYCTKIFPTEELRNKLVQVGVPRYKHDIGNMSEMLPKSCKIIKGSLWCVNYDYVSNRNRLYISKKAITLASAMGLMLEFLLKEGILK